MIHVMRAYFPLQTLCVCNKANGMCMVLLHSQWLCNQGCEANGCKPLVVLCNVGIVV